MAGNPLYATPEWRATRTLILARDGYLCQIHGPRCTVRATEVDHITPLARGGAPYDLANLRAACKPCNASEGAIVGNQLREPRSEDPYR